MHRFVAFAALSSFTFLASGCGSSEAPLPKFPAVTGTVTLDGKALPGATVSFIPTTTGDRGSGITDDSGKYSLKGARGGDGVPAGEYRVAVSRMLNKDGTVPPPGSPPAIESILPAYSDTTKSTLKASVGSSGGNFDFSLKSR